MQEILNIHETAGMLNKSVVYRTFPEVLKDVQEYISKNFASVLRDNPDENRELIESYIGKYLEQSNVGVEGMEQAELCDLLYGEMTGFSFLTRYLYRDDVEEININQWRDVKITYSTGEIIPAKEHFNSAGHAVDVIRRLLHKSGMIFDNAKRLAVSIRIVNPRKLTKEQFVGFGTATGEMLDLLSMCFTHGVSMCITGATSSGKTTLMSWILGEVPYSKRIVTIEQGCREFDLTAVDEEGNVLNNVVHLVTRFSDDPRQNIDMVKLLETTLTINPDCIAVAEMKGGESMQAINAANTGHSVITTIHANSCEDTYYRMVTLCKQEQPGMDDATLQNLATKAFPIVAFAKRLEDNSRRIMEITECETLQDGRKKMRTLYRFNITDNIIVEGKPKIIGHYEKVENLSEGLQKRLRENGLPLKMQEQFLAKR